MTGALVLVYTICAGLINTCAIFAATFQFYGLYNRDIEPKWFEILIVSLWLLTLLCFLTGILISLIGGVALIFNKRGGKKISISGIKPAFISPLALIAYNYFVSVRLLNDMDGFILITKWALWAFLFNFISGGFLIKWLRRT